MNEREVVTETSKKLKIAGRFPIARRNAPRSE